VYKRQVQDRVAEALLPLLDALLNVLTLGAWVRWQGGRVPNLKVKK